MIALAFACSGIHPEEIECEDAVGHLQQCCPGFNPSNLYCVYDTSDCENTQNMSYPDFDSDQSACIRNESCEVLRSSGVCARAGAIPSGQQVLPLGASYPTLVVCP